MTLRYKKIYLGGIKIIKFKKHFLLLLSFLLVFTAIGPTLVSATQTEPTIDDYAPRNNSNLTEKELLNLDLEDFIENDKVIDNTQGIEVDMTDQEANTLVQEIYELKDEDYKLDDETFAYIDTINPDIDIQELIDQEENIEDELGEIGEVNVLFAPIVIRGAITATTALLRKAGIKSVKVSYHLGKRMLQRGISPKQVYDTVRKGKKYYDPKYKSTVYYYKGIAVAKKGNTFTTTYKSSKPKARWR